jgi:hypothetical protein
LELKQTTGNIYIHAQIFTAVMYIAAAMCMWFLRAWKVGELEELAAEEGKAMANVDPLEPQRGDEMTHRSMKAKSSLLKRLLKWKRA